MRFALVLRLVLASLLAHRRQNAVTALVLGLDAFLVVVALALLSALTPNLQATLTSTLAGHAHVYGAATSGDPDLLQFGNEATFGAPLLDYPAVEAALLADPDVAAVVPMASAMVAARHGNRLDRTLERARQAARDRDAAGLAEGRRQVVSQVQRLLGELGQAEVPGDQAGNEARAALVRALSPALWEEYARQPLAVLERLENDVAPVAGNPQDVPITLICTPAAGFAAGFSRFELLQGRLYEPGSGGLLLNQGFYDRRFKLPLAWDLDQLRDEVVEDGRRLPPPVLAARVERLVEGIPELLRALHPNVDEELRRDLAKALGREAASLEELLRASLEITPETLAERHRLFYEVVAPRLELYSIALGEVLTLQNLGQHGYVTSVSATLTGIYRFVGTEAFMPLHRVTLADPALATQLMGAPDAALRSEVEAMQRGVSLVPLAKGDVEGALFAEGADLEIEGELSTGIPVELAAAADAIERRAGPPPVEHAAVLLRDPATLEAALARLRPHLPAVRLLGWTEAGASVAQYIQLIAVQLYVALGIFLAIALLVVNVSVVLVTLERRRELATLRAIGASPVTIFGIVTGETLLVGLLAGLVAAWLGQAVVGWLADTGLPPRGPVLSFLFGGAPLRPVASLAQAAAAVAVVAGVGALAALYPARLATRVPPAAAMTESSR